MLDVSFRIFHNPLILNSADYFIIAYSSIIDSRPELSELVLEPPPASPEPPELPPQAVRMLKHRNTARAAAKILFMLYPPKI